ncbi:DUF4340 domain-containing protein [Vallitalea pronyensis]|uniref:DUF4340 domain-containing protein n=1 Tax=Vallitalea pronyensis TaxID=1348613 RepID=A0A8J8SI33_9FIRM|nr:DUF4340 domain-containing protein [Vallitalea pronyensis]QUI24042.1 DUF4340 domain-containing protein [Vallitalea pronyensis]
MKEVKGLIGLGIVTVVLLSGYLLYGVMSRENEETKFTHSIEAIQHAESVHDFSIDTINTVILQHGHEALHMKKEERWKVQGIHPDKINNRVLQQLLDGMIGLRAEKQIDTYDNLEDYGFSNPPITIHFSLENDIQQTTYVGQLTMDGRHYYVKQASEKSIFLVAAPSIDELFALKSKVMLSNIPHMDANNITSIKIEKNHGHPIHIQMNPVIDEDKASFGIGVFSIIDYYEQPRDVDFDAFDRLRDKVMDINKCEYYSHGEDNDMNDRLSEPPLTLTIRVEHGEEDIVLYISKNENTGLTYIKRKGYPDIYGLNTFDMAYFLGLTHYDLMNKYLKIVYIDQVNHICIKTPDKTYGFDIDTTNNQYRLEQAGKRNVIVEEKTFKNLYQQLIGITVDAEISDEETIDAKEVFSIEYDMFDGESIRLGFEAYDDLYYRYREGHIQLICSTKQFEKILWTMENMLKD